MKPGRDRLTHFDEGGAARMVDVAAKPDTHRAATATGAIRMHADTLKLIRGGGAKKGDVLGVARIAGIQAAKRTGELIPLCHPLALTKIEIEFVPEARLPGITVTARVETIGKTGVEMEALTATCTALLTIYDMCKAVDRSMSIEDVQLQEKSGGQSGHYRRSSRPRAGTAAPRVRKSATRR